MDPRNPRDFISTAASGLMDIQSLAASMIQEDNATGMSPGEGMFASMMAPTNVTASVKAQIKALPTSSLILYLHLDQEFEDEGTTFMCIAHSIEKEHGSDGKPYADSDGFGMALAQSALLDTANDLHGSKTRSLLGTLAKACLEPMGGGGFSVMTMLNPTMRSQMQEMYPPSRPAKVLFQTRGIVEMLRDELKQMGIRNVDVAEQNLIQSCELFASTQNMQRDGPNLMEDNIGDPRALANHLRDQVEGPYVSEVQQPLRGWNPPNGPGDIPYHWYAQPPQDPNAYRPSTLFGWRTNLERAVLGEDKDVVERITSQQSASDVREYVECRMLLTKMAMRGLVNACKLLLDKCGASVEGAQAPDSKGWWKAIQNKSGNYGDLTPLHEASRNGKHETVRLLLDYGANVNQIDKAEVRGSPLQHAVSRGEIDCVQLLCERGADHTHVGVGGEALDISEMMRQSDVSKVRVQEKVQQILREYDPRCSYCRQPNPQKRCPCMKERYCDATCQRNRWKLHKKYHRLATCQQQSGQSAES